MLGGTVAIVKQSIQTEGQASDRLALGGRTARGNINAFDPFLKQERKVLSAKVVTRIRKGVAPPLSSFRVYGYNGIA